MDHLVAIMIIVVTIVLVILNIYNAFDLGIFRWLKIRKKQIATTLGWSVAIALVIIKSYWIVYLRYPVLSEAKIIYTDVLDWTPRIDLWDLLIIFLFSLLAGAILLDIDKILYGFIASSFLSFAFAVTWSSFFIWFSIGVSEFLELFGFWTTLQFVLYGAVKNVFRMIFPTVQMLAFFGVFLGAFVRAYLQPSVES